MNGFTKNHQTFQFDIEYHFGKQRSIAIQQNAWIKQPWIHSEAAGTQRPICGLWNLCILLQCTHFKCSFVWCFLFFIALTVQNNLFLNIFTSSNKRFLNVLLFSNFLLLCHLLLFVIWFLVDVSQLFVRPFFFVF